MKVLKLGIIGQGRSGRNIHAEFLKNVPQKFQIACVADLLPDRGERARQEYGCEAFTDYRQMLERRDLDLIVNASTSQFHVPITREALAAGFNVLCEKPLARRAAEVDDLIATAKKAGKFLAIYQQSRFAPYYRQVCEVLKSGVLGRIALIKCVQRFMAPRLADAAELNGRTLNTGPHPMDQVLGLIGRHHAAGLVPDGPLNIWGHTRLRKIILSYRATRSSEICSNTPYPYSTYASTAGMAGCAATWVNRLEVLRPVRSAALPAAGTAAGSVYCSDPA